MGSTQKAKIAVLVSGGGTNLQALIDAQVNGIINSGVISLVISNNANAYALTRAENAGIATSVVTKKSLALKRRLRKSSSAFWKKMALSLLFLQDL